MTPLDSIPKGEVNPMPPVLFDTGEALRRLKEGRFVTRQGWNGKGMYVFLVPGEGRMLPYLCMSTVKGELVPWLISQTDALAMDWFEVVADVAAAAALGVKAEAIEVAEVHRVLSKSPEYFTARNQQKNHEGFVAKDVA